MDKKLLKIIKIALILISFYLIYLMYPGILKILSFAFRLLLPFLVGFTGAFILLPIVDWLCKKGLPRKISVFLVFGLSVGLVVLGIATLAPLIVKQLTFLVDNIPTYLDNAQDFLDSWSKNFTFLPDNWLPNTENITRFLTSHVGDIINYIANIIQRTFSYVLSLLISPIIMIYFLLDFDKIVDFLRKKVDRENHFDLRQILIEIRDTMRGYFRGVLLVVGALSVLGAIAFMLIGLDLPILWGVLVGVTDIIPYLGPYIGGIIVVLFSLTTSFEKAIITTLVIIILQAIEGNFLTPNIQSKTVKTHPILVLFSMTLFGQILGIFGMIIAVPVLSIVQIIFRHKFFVHKY